MHLRRRVRSDDCLFVSNHTPPGGAIVHLRGISPLIEHCTFADNAAPGGSVLDCRFVVYFPVSPGIRNSILAFTEGGAAVSCDAESEPALAGCDLYGNEGGDWTGCVAGQLGSGGNFSADPLFCDRTAGDDSIRADSPCAPPQIPECGLVGARPVGGSGPTPAGILRWGRSKWLYGVPGRKG